jgi:GNAT superfamily N-acetyltransferase
MSRHVQIRIAHPDDRPNLIEVQRRASLASETGEVRQRLLEEPDWIDIDEELLANNEVIVAEIGPTIVGFASFIAQDGNDAELDGMFVEPSHWRQGIGRLLIKAVERELVAWQATRLRVVANPNALAFYKAVGFIIIGEEKTPLGPVAPVMAKAITGRS